MRFFQILKKIAFNFMRLFALTKMKKEPSEIFREFEERDEIVSGGWKSLHGEVIGIQTIVLEHHE